MIAELAHETDFEGWRAAARRLCEAGVAPEAIEWRVEGGEPMLPGAVDGLVYTRKGGSPRAPRVFVEQARRVVCHRDPERFGRLHRLLWRLQEKPKLLEIASDLDVAWLHRCDKAIRRDIHKMHAFVRFRKVGEADGRERFVAWFEPEHRITELAAPFFMRRFRNMDWAILTPDQTAVWDGRALQFGPGARRGDAPAADVIEEQWRAYFSAIFNPARLKVKAMMAEMPKKYWRNLPEADCIPTLIEQSEGRMDHMQFNAVTAPSALARRLKGRGR